MRGWRTLALLVVAGLAAASAACAPKIAPLPTVTSPAYPDFIKPTVPAALVGGLGDPVFERGWLYLQAGDLKSAEQDLTLALRATPSFYPATTALGYLRLARKDADSALKLFDSVLAGQADDVSALVGRGQALLALNRQTDAITALNQAVAADPSLADVRRQVEVLKFRSSERNLDAARQAARSSNLDEAIRLYQASIASSPESAFLYRELAAVERQKGDNDEALNELAQAIKLDPGDAASLAVTGEILEARGDFAGALNAYDRSLAVDPSENVKAERARASAAASLAQLPEEYRAIGAAAQITRADLAALVGVRLGSVIARARQGEAVVTDVRNNWAEHWIIQAVSAGVMDPFANHTFQPRTVVHRTDLADAVSRLLTLIANPADLQRWRSRQIRFPDLASTHLAFPSASLAIASGMLTQAPDGSFEPSRAVSGAEAIAAIERLQTMAGVAGRR